MVRTTRESWSRKLMMEIRRRRESSALQRTARTLPITENSFQTAPRWGSASGARDPWAISASKEDGKGTLRANMCSRLSSLLAVDAASTPGPEACCTRVTRGAPPAAEAAAPPPARRPWPSWPSRPSGTHLVVYCIQNNHNHSLKKLQAISIQKISP